MPSKMIQLQDAVVAHLQSKTIAGLLPADIQRRFMQPLKGKEIVNNAAYVMAGPTSYERIKRAGLTPTLSVRLALVGPTGDAFGGQPANVESFSETSNQVAEAMNDFKNANFCLSTIDEDVGLLAETIDGHPALTSMIVVSFLNT